MKPLLSLLLVVAVKTGVCQVVKDTLATKSLKGITVSATKRLIEVQPDKTVLNVDASPTAIGQNALELLRQSPGVVVDAAENIQLAGRSNVTVLIDGKNTQLSATDLAELLKSIEASNIRQIELITSPSAKYDAAGASGIINIKLKKALTDGFNGNLTGSYVQSRHARENAAANINWRKGNTAVFINAGVSNGLQHVIATNNRQTNSGLSIRQRSIEKDVFGGHSFRAGLDYSLSKKATLGVLWMKNYRYTRMNNNSTSLLHYPLAADTLIVNNSLAPFPTDRNSFNLNYNYTTTGFTYTLDADYTRFNSSLNNQLYNDVQNVQGQKFYSVAISNNAQVRIILSSLKGDAEKTFASGLKLETGFKLMQTATDNRLQVNYTANSQWLIDTGKTNLFRYNETIGALYASVKSKPGRFSWQTGLRSEYTRVRGRSTDLKGSQIQKPDTGYLNLFPTLFLQYKLSAKHSLGLTVNRRIDRPSYQDQNPFVYVLDALNSEQGNPYLLPQFTTHVEVGYTYNYATSIKMGYARTTNYLEGLTYQMGNKTVLIQQNAGTKDMISLSISTPWQPFKWWNFYLSATPYYHYYHILLDGFATTEIQQGGSRAFNGYIGNNFNLGKGWKAELSSWFNYQNRATIYVSKPIGSINMGVQKAVLNDKATLKLSVVDIFNTQRWEQTATTSAFTLTTYRKWESQNLTLGFSWRFGSSKVKQAREREVMSEEDVKRIK